MGNLINNICKNIRAVMQKYSFLRESAQDSCIRAENVIKYRKILNDHVRRERKHHHEILPQNTADPAFVHADAAADTMKSVTSALKANARRSNFSMKIFSVPPKSGVRFLLLSVFCR